MNLDIDNHWMLKDELPCRETCLGSRKAQRVFYVCSHKDLGSYSVCDGLSAIDGPYTFTTNVPRGKLIRLMRQTLRADPLAYTLHNGFPPFVLSPLPRFYKGANRCTVDDLIGLLFDSNIGAYIDTGLLQIDDRTLQDLTNAEWHSRFLRSLKRNRRALRLHEIH